MIEYSNLEKKYETELMSHPNVKFAKSPFAKVRNS